MTVRHLPVTVTLFVLSLLLSTTVRAVPPRKMVDNTTTRATPGSEFPWKLDREHRFLWLHQRNKVGETRFVVRLVPYPGRPGERLVEVRATRSYQREAVAQQATSTTHVSVDGAPEHYEEQLTVLHATSARRSTQKTTVERRGSTTRSTFVQNGRAERPSVDERVLEAGTFLCASQAVEHWAIFVANLPKTFERHTVKLYYPDQRRVFNVQLTGKGEETIRIGKSRVAARRYVFRSAKGELDGSLWIGSDGRLLQVTFPQSQLRVVLATE